MPDSRFFLPTYPAPARMGVMADSQYIFDYLNDVWDLLPEQDRIRFGETWKAYEQTYGYVWMQQFETDMGNTIKYLPLYNIKRWLQHEFDSTTQVLMAATFTSNQDFSQGINLSNRYLIRLAIDGGGQIEVDLRGANPAATTLAEMVSNINEALAATIAKAISNNALLQLTSTTKGPMSSISFYAASDPTKDANAIIFGLDPITQLPLTVPKLPYAYQLGEIDIVGIPSLQDTIHDELVTTLLQENIDYSIEFGTAIISFAAIPPAFMWAKDTLVNFETPYNNFGYLMGIYDTNTPAYLKSVQGLWYAFWTGPRPENIRRSLYLLFGLPTASQAGTVTAVTLTTITVTYVDNTTETFTIPTNLSAIVTIGQTLTQYQPLVSGINVYDKINYPGFLRKEAGRPGVQPFLTQYATRGSGPNTDETMALTMLEQNTYLPQINVDAFISPNINLMNVQTFLRNLQPRSRTYLLQVLVGTFLDQLSLQDEGLTGHVTGAWPNGRPALGLDISFDATTNVDWNNNTMGDQDEWDDAENNPYTDMVLDDNTIGFGDFGSVEVYQASVLIDTFNL